MIINQFQFLLVQGRGLKQESNLMQYFPSNWKEEFTIIQKLGFYGIEWIYDKKSESTNPILSDLGRKDMKELSQKYNVKLENIVFDWFIEHPLLKNDQFTISEKIQKFKSLIEISAKTGFKRVIFPLLENNEISSIDERNKFIEILKEITNILELYKIELHLETSLTPEKEKEIIKEINHKKILVCFDMGNSASYGYDPQNVIRIINDYIGSVHIKDRILNGTSVPLGKGNVDFLEVFRTLRNIDFQGPISFQVYRNNNSDNIMILKNSLEFISNIINDVYNE